MQHSVYSRVLYNFVGGWGFLVGCWIFGGFLEFFCVCFFEFLARGIHTCSLYAYFVGGCRFIRMQFLTWCLGAMVGLPLDYFCTSVKLWEFDSRCINFTYVFLSCTAVSSV